MPLSTSSSNERAPKGRWALTWLSAIIVLVIALAGWKTYWTGQGFGVSLPNNSAAWATTRMQLGPESTVFTGTSRTQAGLVPQEWMAETGTLPLQLALVGSSPVPVVEHLATQTDFRGLLIVGVVEMYMFDADHGPNHGKQAMNEYRDILAGPSRRWGVALARLVPHSLLMRNQQLTFRKIVDGLWEGGAPRNLPANMQSNRWMKFQRDNLVPDDLDYEEFENAGRPATAAERDAIIERLDTSVQTIQARGGRVIIVAFPSCGTRHEIERRRYPHDIYWEPLVAGTSAQVINAYSIPQLVDFQCADGSHMDESDARRFTRELARIIEAGR